MRGRDFLAVASHLRELADVARMVGALDPGLTENLTFLRGFRTTADYDMDVRAEILERQHHDSERWLAIVLTRLAALPVPGGDS